MSGNLIDKTAVIDNSAKLGKNVKVGAYVVIGKDVEIASGCEIMHHAMIDDYTSIGENSKVFPFSSIGTAPQDISYEDEKTRVIIGKNNVIREFTTINRGTVKDKGVTLIGDSCYFMAYSHIAHDCLIGNNVLLINGATLAGHVVVEEHVVIGAHSSVHQHVQIGRNAYIGGYTIVLQDVLPFAKIAQLRNTGYNFYGPNSIGMKRSGLSNSYVENVKDIFAILFRMDLNTKQAVEKLDRDFPDCEEKDLIKDFIGRSKRGILKSFK